MEEAPSNSSEESFLLHFFLAMIIKKMLRQSPSYIDLLFILKNVSIRDQSYMVVF